MNPSDVETLKFVKNQPVLLTSDEKKMLFKLSPCTSVPPSSVVLSSFSLFNINLKNSVTVEVFNQLIDYADKMILIFERYKSFMESKNFRRYLSTVLSKLKRIILILTDVWLDNWLLVSQTTYVY